MHATRDQSISRSLLLLIFGAVCISFAPVFVKLVGEDKLGPTAIGFWRTLFGGVVLLTLTLVSGRSLIISRRTLLFALLAGFIFFLDLFVWHRSIVGAGAGMATILGNTQVFFTAFLAYLYFKEQPSLRFFIAAMTATVGVILLVGFFSEDVAFSPKYTTGILWGLATGIAYAHYLITLRWAGSREKISDVMTFMGWTSLFSAGFLGISALIEQVPIMPPDLSTLGLVVALGVVAQAIGWWAITESLGKIEASRAGLVLLLQPTLAMLWGVVFFAEQLTFVQLAGAVLTLAAIYYGGLRGTK